MRRGRWAAAAAALAIAALSAVSAGCGGGTTNALALDPVAAAATKTQQAGAARIRFALDLNSPRLGGGKAIHLRGNGVLDGTSAELSLDMGSLLQQAGAPAGTGSSMKEIFLRQNGDYVLYVQLGLLSSQLPGGKHWVELDVSKLGRAAGVDLGKLTSGSQLSPGDLLSMLKAEGSTIRNLGQARVDGIPTTHYRMTIDVAKALQAKGFTSPLLGGMVAKMPTVPGDVWIGRDGLVHRIRFAFALPQGRVGMTMDVYGYGAAAAIAAPPSGDVFDATQLAQQGFGSLGR